MIGRNEGKKERRKEGRGERPSLIDHNTPKQNTTQHNRNPDFQVLNSDGETYSFQPGLVARKYRELGAFTYQCIDYSTVP